MATESDPIRDIFDQYDQDLTGSPKHWERSEESEAALSKALTAIRQEVERRVVEARIEENKRLWILKVSEIHYEINERLVELAAALRGLEGKR